MFFIDPDGMQADDWISWTDSNGQQNVTYDQEIKTVEQAKDKGYDNVESVFESATAHDTGTDETFNFEKGGDFSVNGGSTMNVNDGEYTTQGGTSINANQSATSQLAPILGDTGDFAVVAGTIMCLTGVGVPLGAGFITYGGYAGTAGTALELIDNANDGTLTAEKVITKSAMELIPGAGDTFFKNLSAPAAGELFNVGTMAADKVIDVLRETKTGPYRQN